ncbi:MAG: hypothetical protein M0R03_06900 [Novosphingobium sp.]|nr:hypothetical protein [Novosphingobium sp.]
MIGGPRIKRIEDCDWQEMSRFQYKDGRTASIWECWVEHSPRFLAFYNRWDPGALSPLHGHHGDHTNLIVKGSLTGPAGTVRAGDHIMLEYGDLFGPWEAGPEGCELYGVVAGEGSAYMGDRKVWEDFLAERGAVSVPVPMPRVPPWWADRVRQSTVVNWIEE